MWSLKEKENFHLSSYNFCISNDSHSRAWKWLRFMICNCRLYENMLTTRCIKTLGTDGRRSVCGPKQQGWCLKIGWAHPNPNRAQTLSSMPPRVMRVIMSLRKDEKLMDETGESQQNQLAAIKRLWYLLCCAGYIHYRKYPLVKLVLNNAL